MELRTISCLVCNVFISDACHFKQHERERSVKIDHGGQHAAHLFGAIIQLVDVRKGVKHDENASERHEANQ